MSLIPHNRQLPTPPAGLVYHLGDISSIDNALLQCYRWMHLSRTTDNRILELFRQGLIRGTVTGGQGNEALITPLALLADRDIDVVSFTHRDLAGHLIWSGHLVDHLNQYFANSGSPTQAREGNVHHGDPANRSLPIISHLGIIMSSVLGGTHAQRRRGIPAVGYAFFGDGGSSTGDIHESMNLASVLSLPILFVIENNEYAYSTPVAEQFHNTPLYQRAAGYGIKGISLDATDTQKSLETFAAAIAEVRATCRPMLIECHTLRLRGHAAYDTCDYLLPGQSDGFFARDPLPRLRAQLAASIPQAQLADIEAQNSSFVEASIQVAMATPPITPVGLADSALAPVAAPISWRTEPATPQTITMAQALNAAHRKILTEDPRSLVLGQDIGAYGGAFKVTEGLLKEFGRERVFNTPLAESACTGYAIGMAVGGYRPIVEYQFADFATDALTQITLNAATMYFRSGARCPIVFRMPCGGGLTFGSFHSQELEAMFLGMPGIKALYPSTPQDAFNALLAAYEDDNPVMLFEHKGLYRRGKHPVVFDPHYRNIWQPRQLRSGSYATFVTYGDMTELAAAACDYFATEYDKSFDLFDLRALAPLRLEAIQQSLRRTHRLVVLHEGRRTHGFGAELVSRLVEAEFFALEAAPLRIASMDIPVPFAPELEAIYRPTRDSIIARIADWIG